MTTEAAQRRLIEALAALDRAGCTSTPPQDALAEFALGIAISRGQLTDSPAATAAVLEAVEDLALAVRQDLTDSADEVRTIGDTNG